MGTALGLLGLLLLLLLPQVQAASKPPAHEPEIDLDRIRLQRGTYVAPLADGSDSAELTLDPELQSAAVTLLRRAKPVRGAIALVDLRSGKLKVFAEHRGKRRRSVLLDSKPPAASVFKLVTTAALLERGYVKPKREVCTVGGLRRIERRHLDAPKKGTAHCAPFFSALGHSRNAVFAQLATHHLMRDDLELMANRIGFNSSLPFHGKAFTGRAEIPYNDLQFARAAAGFGDTTLSPIGGLHLASLIALKGQPLDLRIVERSGDFEAPKRKTLRKRVIRDGTAYQLRRMMEVTVHGGTALDAFTDEKGRNYLPGLRIAAKTGTLKPGKKAPTTTWFVGFFPSRKPRYAFSALLQNGHIWHTKANGLTRDLLRVLYAERRGVTSPLK